MAVSLKAFRLAAALLALQAPGLAQPQPRTDCAPFRLTAPGGTDGFAWWDTFGGRLRLHTVARTGAAHVSALGGLGTINVRLNLIEWECHGQTMTATAVVAARLWPPLLPLERVTGEVVGLAEDQTVLVLAGIAIAVPGDTSCRGTGLAAAPLGGGPVVFPSDWDSSSWLTGRDVVITSPKLPSSFPVVGPVVPWAADWAHAVWEVVP